MSFPKRCSGLFLIVPAMVLLGIECPVKNTPPAPPPDTGVIEIDNYDSDGPDADIGSGDFERTDVDWTNADVRERNAGVSNPNAYHLRCRGADYLPVELGGVDMEVWQTNDGECYPKGQFTVRCPEGNCDCMSDHWHDTLIALSGQVRFDDGTCGSIAMTELSTFGTIQVSPAQADWMTDKQVDLRECESAECLQDNENVFDCNTDSCSVR